MAITKTQIQKWNEYFNSLTKPQKRVAIAEDVIKQIKAKKYLPKQMAYVTFKKLENSEEQIQTNFDKIECTCCALGGLFLSEVKFNNSCTFKELNYNDFSKGNYFEEKPLKRLNKYFSLSQLVLTEFAFECWGTNELYYNDDNSVHIDMGIGNHKTLKELKLTENDIEKACEFGNDYLYPNDRLLAIMKNIVLNEGTFKP